jgi:hypothetical protein
MAMIVKAVKPARSLSIKSISVMFQEISRAEYWQIIDNKAKLSNRENFLRRHLSSEQAS